MNVFDIVGPVMIGPSSSHTAGALRLGRVARTLLAESPEWAEIVLYASFAATGRGHGTDRALLAGLMGMETDDAGVRTAFGLAEQHGLTVQFLKGSEPAWHPNQVDILARSASGRQVRMSGASVGGGAILVRQINGIEVAFTGELHTLIVVHRDKPGVVAGVARALAREAVNIAGMRLYRSNKGGQAIMVLETDQPVLAQVAEAIQAEDGVTEAVVLSAMPSIE